MKHAFFNPFYFFICSVWTQLEHTFAEYTFTIARVTQLKIMLSYFKKIAM